MPVNFNSNDLILAILIVLLLQNGSTSQNLETILLFILVYFMLMNKNTCACRNAT